jgi:hypothetical protein
MDDKLKKNVKAAVVYLKNPDNCMEGFWITTNFSPNTQEILFYPETSHIM